MSNVPEIVSHRQVAVEDGLTEQQREERMEAMTKSGVDAAVEASRLPNGNIDGNVVTWIAIRLIELHTKFVGPANQDDIDLVVSIMRGDKQQNVMRVEADKVGQA